MDKRYDGRRAAGIAITVMSASLLISGQEPGGTPQVFRSGVELVTIDVNVLDRQGTPLRGLTAADFTVTVEGRPRRVVSAEFIDRAAARARVAARPELEAISTNDGAGIGRQIIFVVDQATLDTATARYAARAAERLFAQLTFADRTGLIPLPVGKSVNLTWSHDEVRAAIQRVAGTSGSLTSWEFGSLSEARDIANRSMTALQAVSQRECGNALASARAGGSDSGTVSGVGGGTTSPPGGGRGGTTGGGSTTSTGGGGGGGFGGGSCMRNIQVQAESTWRIAYMTSQSSIAALRQVFQTLARVHGDKTVILLSGGWPLEQHDEVSALTPLVSAAAAARVTLFPIFIPRSRFSAAQASMSATPSQDQNLQIGPLHHLANLTGGELFRAEVSAESAFDRLGRQLSGYYRIGVEREVDDQDGKARRLDVDVARAGSSVRARAHFDVLSFEDRNATARLASALESPLPADGIPMRLTSYVAPDPGDPRRLTLMLAGDATRLRPGDANLQVVVRDLDGHRILSGEPPVSQATDDGLQFAMNIPLPPGSYVVRVGVMDSAGHVGSVEHRAEVRRVPVGAMTATGPVLVRVPGGSGREPRIAVGSAGQDDRLALEIGLEGDRQLIEGAAVTFEVAPTTDGPPLITTTAMVSSTGSDGGYLAQAVADLRVLPPGEYIARARITPSEGVGGELRRWFVVTGASTPTPGRPASSSTSRGTSSVPLTARTVGAVGPFAAEHVLAPAVLTGFLDRIAARPDARSPMIRELVERARTDGIASLPVSDTLAAQSAVAAFLRGLKFFAAQDFPAAAAAFRAAMRASPDMFPAMVYLGACYAAGGKDKEAAGAWQTALIGAGDEIAIHRLLADALLRLGSGDRALQAVERARTKWPDDEQLRQRFVVAALLGGKPAEGLQALDTLIEHGVTVEEPTLALALLVLYESFEQQRPVEGTDKDRARMLRLAAHYRERGGPALALVETWVSAVKSKG